VAGSVAGGGGAAAAAGDEATDPDGGVKEDADLRVVTADYAAAVKDTLDPIIRIFPSGDDGIFGRWQKRGAVFISTATKAAMVDAAQALEVARLAVKAPLVAVCAAYDAPEAAVDARLLSPAAAARFD